MITKKVKMDCDLGREVLIFDYRQAGLKPPAVLPASMPVFSDRGRHFADAIELRLEDGKLFGVIRIRPLKPLQFDESESKLIH